MAGTIAYTTKDASDFVDDSNKYLSLTLSNQNVNSQQKVTVLGAFVLNNIETLVQLSGKNMNQMKVHDDATETLNPMSGEQDSVLAKLKISLDNDSSITMTFDNQESDSDYNLLTDLGSGFSAANMQVENVSSSVGLDTSNREEFR